jgi:small subunit ribosomal protein S2
MTEQEPKMVDLNNKFKKETSDSNKKTFISRDTAKGSKNFGDNRKNNLNSSKIVRKGGAVLHERIPSKKIKVGDTCVLKISALGPKGIGIDEYSYGYSIFVHPLLSPLGAGVEGVKLGEMVKAKVVKIAFTNVTQEVGTLKTASPLLGGGQKEQYAVAQLLEVITKKTSEGSRQSLPSNSTKNTNLPVQPDEVLTVNIEKLVGKNAGLVNLNNGYKLIIPNAQIKNNVTVIVTRVKDKYAFAKLGSLQKEQQVDLTNLASGDLPASLKPLPRNVGVKGETTKNLLATSLLEGSKYSLNLPKSGKYYGNYVILKLEGLITFIKLSLGAKPGNKVRIKITKVNQKFAIAKVIQINPTSLFKKRILVQNSICQMVKNGMHLGEKAVKCNAKMKNYVWKSPAYSATSASTERLSANTPKISGALKQGKSLLRGRQGQNKNRPLIKKGRHIINLLKTRRCLNKALTQLSKYALKGRTFMFIGTKKPAAGLIARASLFSKTSFFVNTRWLGGMLTNWKTILKSISKIRPILKEKQKIVADILEKRQTIKLRLIKKALLLKKKSKLILSKGRFLINQFKDSSFRENILQKTKTLYLKRKQLVENCYSLLSKRQILITKRRELMYQSIMLKDTGLQVISRYKNLLNQLTIYSKKLRELKYLLILSSEIKTIKNKARQENKEILNISYGKVKELSTSLETNKELLKYNLLPNPPKDILNLILLTIIPSGISPTGSVGLNNQNMADDSGKNIKTKSTTNNKVLILSKLVSKFSRFIPYLKNLIKTYQQNIKEIINSLIQSKDMLAKIKTTFKAYVQLKTTLVKELNVIKTKLTAERNIIRIVKTKLKHFAAQKRLIKFLPRLRYLATPLFTNKIMETVKILMKKIVDPKLKYPVDNIYDEKLSNNSKKVGAARKKKWQRLEKYFGGISNMTKMTKSQVSKNIAIIVGQKEEINAVLECQKLGIKMFNIVDTNCNPSLATHIIPANDDSRNSIKYILNKFLVRIRLSQKLRKKLVRLAKS